MKIIGDTHGRTIWKQFLPDIFIGDYFDSWDISADQQISNFLDICKYSRDFDKIMLVGNHDIQYLIQEKYSGYQPIYSFQIREVLLQNMDILKMSYTFENYLCSHAGVSKIWCKNYDIDPYQPLENLVFEINEMFRYKQPAFCFEGIDPSGDDVSQSPVWIRPRSLQKCKIDNCTHIVGHTSVENIEYENNVYFIDCLSTVNNILII